MTLRNVFLIKEGDVIDFQKERDKRTLPMGAYYDIYQDDIDNMKLSFEDYADGPFPYEDYSAQEKLAFRKLYIQKYGNQPIGADEWNALHDEFDARPKRKLSVLPREE